MTKKNYAKQEIAKANPNIQWTIKKLHEYASFKKELSIDTVREALKDLLEEGTVESSKEGKNVFYKIIVKEEIKVDPTDKPANIEKRIIRTRWDRGWKTATIVNALRANKGEKVYRWELCKMVGSDPHNVQMIIKTLRAGTKKFPAMDITYDRTDRTFTLN